MFLAGCESDLGTGQCRSIEQGIAVLNSSSLALIVLAISREGVISPLAAVHRLWLTPHSRTYYTISLNGRRSRDG